MTHLTEEKIETILRKHLHDKGWTKQNSPKSKGQHGCDIIATNPRWNKTFYIEVKGETENHKEQTKNNAFWTLFGQILSRMDIQGNSKNNSRRYALAIPANWHNTFKNKIKEMSYGWKLLKLEVFLVSKNNVEKKSNSYFLKSK